MLVKREDFRLSDYRSAQSLETAPERLREMPMNISIAEYAEERRSSNGTGIWL